MRVQRRAALVLLGPAFAVCGLAACEPRKPKARASAVGAVSAHEPIVAAPEGPAQVVVPLEVKGGKASLPAVKAPNGGDHEIEREAREEASGAAAPNLLVLGSKIPSASNVPWPEVPPNRADALGSAFRPVTILADELLGLARRAPELARFGPEFTLFAKEDVGRVTNVNGPAFQRLTFTTEPVLWQPKQGVLLLVVPYRGSKGSVVAAFWELDGGGHRLAAAFALADEAVPMALVYEAHKREELHWSACWNCPGGQGEVLLKDDGRVVIAQR